MSSLEGLNAIEAAKQRVATAENVKKSASEALKLAQKQFESAQKQFKSAEDEEKKAELSLEEIYKRLEVIDVDDDGGAASAGKRKRGVSLSPAHGNGKKVRADGVAAAAVAPAAGKRKRGVSLSRKKVRASSVAPVRESTDGDVSVVDQIVVEGAGVPEANGTYKRCQCDRQFPVFSKSGVWEGKSVRFFINRCRQFWYISVYKHGSKREHDLYHNHTLDAELPPKSGWRSCKSIKYQPAPQLKW